MDKSLIIIFYIVTFIIILSMFSKKDNLDDNLTFKIENTSNDSIIKHDLKHYKKLEDRRHAMLLEQMKRLAITNSSLLSRPTTTTVTTVTNIVNGTGGSADLSSLIELSDLSSTNVAASGIGNLAYNSSTGKFVYTPPDLSSLIELSDLSATNVGASGIGNLAYNSSTGKFTYTPPDLSEFKIYEKMPFSTNDFLVNANTTDSSISLINKTNIESSETIFFSITIFKTNTSYTTDGGYIANGVYTKLKNDNIFTIDQEFNTNNDFIVDIDTNTGILQIQNVTSNSIVFTILLRIINMNGICTKVALNGTDYTLNASATSSIDYKNIIGVNPGGMMLSTIKIFKTGSNTATSGGFVLKSTHGSMKNQEVYTIEHSVSNSAEFTSSFDSNNGLINLTNNTSSPLELTLNMKYVPFFTNSSRVSFVSFENVLSPWKRYVINLPLELNISSGRTVLLAVVIYKKNTELELKGGYLSNTVYSNIKNQDFFSTKMEFNNSSDFSVAFNTSDGNISISNLTNSNIDLKIKISTIDIF